MGSGKVQGGSSVVLGGVQGQGGGHRVTWNHNFFFEVRVLHCLGTNSVSWMTGRIPQTCFQKGVTAST